MYSRPIVISDSICGIGMMSKSGCEGATFATARLTSSMSARGSAGVRTAR
jgi:hypothetical protein